MEELEIVLEKEIDEIDIVILEENIANVYPKLEDLEIKPSGVEQNFKSEKYYGYDNVKVKAVASETLNVTPAMEEQQITGLFGIVNVEPATEIYNDGYNNGYAEAEETLKGGLSQYAKGISFPNLNIFGEKDVVLEFENLTSLSNCIVVNNAENVNTTAETLTISSQKPILEMSKLYYCDNANIGDNTLEKITLNIDTSQCNNFAYMFAHLRALKVIDGNPLDFTNASQLTLPLAYLIALEEVRFVPGSIYKDFNMASPKNMSDETLDSIVNGLGNLNGEIKFYEVGPQVGPSDFEYPEVEKELENVTDYYDAYYFMTDGTPVYWVTYGEWGIQTYAYAKGGMAQTLLLPSSVKTRMSDTQKAMVTAKNWNIAWV